MSTVNEQQFDEINCELMKIIGGWKKCDLLTLSKKIKSTYRKEADHRSHVEQSLRISLGHGVNKASIQELKDCIVIVIKACRADLCSPNTPIVLLSDIFDVSVISKCEELFAFVEENVAIWKESLFFAPSKNNLLRLCNDLLRRLSRSQNMVFCGRILLFLARFFPFSERSGLNVVGEFNTGNRKLSELSDSMDMEVEDELTTYNGNKTEYTLYDKFWKLQDFFSCPNDCYSKANWSLFTSHTSSVLTALQGFQLGDSYRKASSSHEDLTKMDDDDTTEKNYYFPEFLTSRKLFELQLTDHNFRRTVLVQFLIVFQYLTSPVKFKPDNCQLRELQVDWVNENTKKVYDIIRQIPPDGSTFATTIHHLLEREVQWNNWKNEGCPEIKPPYPVMEEINKKSKFYIFQQRNPVELLKQAKEKNRFCFADPVLLKLWNKCPDNLQACRSKSRDFLPSVDSYFEGVLEEANPAAMVEPQFKKVNNPEFAWRGLRLLARKSPHFFAHNNTPIHKIPDFLENMVRKVSKDSKTVVEEKMELMEQDPICASEESPADEVKNDVKEPIETSQLKSSGIPKEKLTQIVPLVTDKWRELAAKMSYQPDEIDFMATQNPTDLKRTENLFQVWLEDDEDPSVTNLVNILRQLDLLEACKVLQSS